MIYFIVGAVVVLAIWFVPKVCVWVQRKVDSLEDNPLGLMEDENCKRCERFHSGME